MSNTWKSRRICFFSGDITRCGGTERIAIMLANELARDPDTEVVFLSWSEGDSKPFFTMDPRIRRNRLFPFNFPFRFFYKVAAKKLKSFLRKDHITHLIDIDVILTNVSARAIAQTDCKLIAWEHFHYHEDLGCKLRQTGRETAKDHADAIVTLTEGDRKQYESLPSNARIVAIPNAIMPPTENEVTDMPEGPFILSVGRLCYQKGFDRLPAIAEKIFTDNDNWKWLVVGDGPDQKKLKSEIELRGLSERIFLAGRCDAAPFFHHAAFTVMMSRFEGFPLVLLESLERHCPVVAFDCPNGPTEVIQNGVNGFLIPAEDVDALTQKIQLLMNDNALRKTLSQAARDSIRAFTPEVFFERWRALLAEVEA